MRKISVWLDEISKGWVVLLSLGIFVLFMIFVLPDQAEKAKAYTRGGDSPDTSFFYTPVRLFQMANDYGEEGRQAYIRTRFTFDLIFPLVYGIFLVSTISWLGSRTFMAGSDWRLFNLVPVLGVLFDLLENISVSLVMAGYPQERFVLAGLASGFTLLKWVFVYGSFGVLFTVGSIWLYKQIKKIMG